MPTIKENQNIGSFLLETTKNLARHKAAYKQMLRESIEKAEKYKTEKEELNTRFKLFEGFGVVDKDIDAIQRVLDQACLSEDEDEVSAYEKQNPQYFNQQQKKKNYSKNK